MRIGVYILALAPFFFVGCAAEPTTTVTTTTTTQEVTTTGPVTRPVTREVLVTQTPPPVRIESQTIAPGPRYVWTHGYWRWNGAGYQWVPGSWVVRPNPGSVWVEGHWVRRAGGWVWVAGYWR
jgi:WXXGXW repeat (2 copies)